MFSCDHLRHPFQNDPGTSQGERSPAGLLGDTTPIDGRQISDLLNYFTALAQQINFYNSDGSVGSWKPFFSSSLPFLLSSISGYSGDSVKEKMGAVVRLFREHPTPDGLQLLFYQAYYTAIYPLQQWSLGLAGSGLGLELSLQTLIRDRLQSAIKEYISHGNTAAHCFGVKPPSPAELQTNPVWGLVADDLMAYDANFSCGVPSRRSQLLAVEAELSTLADDFADVLNGVTSQAAGPVNTDLYGLLTNGGRRDTPPHLALLFSFLNQFLNVQAHLNSLPKKHLDFFFQQVMTLSPGASVPDSAYVVFGLQKQVPAYAVAAGTLLKAGKDSLGADVVFGVAQDTGLTQTQVASLRTVFVNQQSSGGQVYTEGVYMAPDATMADGISKPFKDPANAAWPALGAKQSLYVPPGAAGPVDYPPARLGFILASKVLLMKEGKRMVRIHLACQWRGLCNDGMSFASLFTKAAEAVSSKYAVITADVLAKAATMGVTTDTIGRLTDHYLTDPCKRSPCDGAKKYQREQALVQMPVGVSADDFWKKELAAIGITATWEVEILAYILVPQSLFMVSFSGEKAWLTPDSLEMQLMSAGDASAMTFVWEITAKIEPGRPAVAFYNAATLGEDFNTGDPLVKIQLNDTIKWELAESSATAVSSCLQQPGDTCGQAMSAYEFFRNVVLVGAVSTGQNSEPTTITVTVCGVTSLVLQNDDNVLDGNKNFTPFGVKPAIVDFDVYPVQWPDTDGFNLVGPSFLIGSAEVFLKKWDDVYINITWVGKPKDLNEYYKAYTHYPRNESIDLCDPGPQVNLALLHDGGWYKEAPGAQTLPRQPSITDDNRRLFCNTGCQAAVVGGGDCTKESFSGCPPKDLTNTDIFHLIPGDFDQLPPLEFDPSFTPFTQYSTNLQNGFVRFTLEYQDFLHKIYPWVLAQHVIDQAHRLLGEGHHPAPNEPWTPLIQKGMSIDYQATAMLEDITLIQLYPFDGTYNTVDIAGEPALFATFCDEGNLFIGLSGLVPGETLNILFQLAEATGDTEDKAGVLSWSFLAGNAWQPLRSGFEILQDDTNGLTTTGIIRFALPDTINNTNTLLPAGQYWVRASLTTNTAGSSRILSVLTQAALTTYVAQATNDPQRAATPLAKGTITKLIIPDASVAKVNQPFDSFGGSAPEASGKAYYLRVSERMRHKGRAIQKWDYERLVLQQFPKLLRAKCINHSTALDSHAYRQDFPLSPGDIVLAVLPDISKLTVADNLRPTVPMSMLTAMEKFLADRISPWARLTARNPRYEPVDICVTVSLVEGVAANVAQAQLTKDLQGFLAPWLDGDLEAFQFARRLYLSDVVGLVESRSYIASLIDLRIGRQGEQIGNPEYIDPLTPRSILVAGTIEVTITSQAATPNDLFWKKRLKK